MRLGRRSYAGAQVAALTSAATSNLIWDDNYAGGAIPGGITATSSANGTYINSSGLLTTAGTTGRITYNPVSLDCLGVLVEGARTNLLLRSQEIDNRSEEH